jgi:hypothetical protein
VVPAAHPRRALGVGRPLPPGAREPAAAAHLHQQLEIHIVALGSGPGRLLVAATRFEIDALQRRGRQQRQQQMVSRSVCCSPACSSLHTHHGCCVAHNVPARPEETGAEQSREGREPMKMCCTLDREVKTVLKTAHKNSLQVCLIIAATHALAAGHPPWLLSTRAATAAFCGCVGRRRFRAACLLAPCRSPMWSRA